MATNAPMIRKNRLVWNELRPKDRDFHVLHLDSSKRASDSYFAQLCAGCHLHKAKDWMGPYEGYSKGGGCLACHLQAGEEGHAGIGRVQSDRACLHCHSRSGRISLSYQGLAELSEAGDRKSTELADGRRVYQTESDLHFRAKMQCQDCHRGPELMHMTKDGQGPPRVRCEDCHLPTSQSRISELGLRLEAVPSKSPKPEDIPASKEQDRVPSSLSLSGGGSLDVPVWKRHHGHDPLHKRLSCSACHSRWAPNCFGCHIEFEANREGFNHITGKPEAGRWQEYHGEYRASPPALGVDPENRIVPVVPGMKLSIDATAFYRRRVTRRHSKKKDKIIKKNIFSRLAPHTVGRARSCRSCHLSPEALGYGKGSLAFPDGRLQFQNEYEIEKSGPHRGIAVDGWIRPGSGHRQDDGLRSLNPEEQLRVLNVGRCLLAVRGLQTDAELWRRCSKGK